MDPGSRRSTYTVRVACVPASLTFLALSFSQGAEPLSFISLFDILSIAFVY